MISFVERDIRKLAEKEAKMQDLLKKDGVEQLRDPDVTDRNMGIFSSFLSRFKVTGLENLQKAEKSTRESGVGRRITPRHGSDLESLASRYIWRNSGLEDFANNTVWVAGVNMLLRPYTAIFMGGEHVIYIATPSDLEAVANLIEKKKVQGSNAELKQLLEIENTFKKINAVAKEKVKGIKERGENLLVYPEAGRSYDGYMKRAPGQVSVYFPRGENTMILPYRIIGATEINPPKRLFRVWKVIPGFRQDLEMIVGEEYPTREIWEWARLRRREGAHVNPVDWVMANIANISPTEIRPDELSYYRSEILHFRPERNRIPEPVDLAA